MNKSPKIMLFLMSFVLVLGLGLPNGAAAAIPKEFSASELVGEPIQQGALFHSVYGTENGRPVVYTTSAAAPAQFNVVDIESNEVLFVSDLPNGNSAWSHAIAPNGDVYIGTSDGSANIIRYNPVDRTLTTVVSAAAGATSVWSMTADEEGVIYFGTFNKGKVFSYNPATETLRDYGEPIVNQSYVRSIAYKEGYIYAGIGSSGHLVKINAVTGEKETIALKAVVDGVTRTTYPFVYGLDIRGDYLFAQLEGDGLVGFIIYDLLNKVWLDEEFIGGIGRVSPIHNGKVYFIQSGKLIEWDLAEQTSRDTSIAYGSSLRGSGWVDFSGSSSRIYPNPLLVTVAYAGRTVFFDIEQSVRHLNPIVVLGGPMSIHSLEKGTDGKLYMGGYTASSGSIYDVVTDTFSSFVVGQPESIGTYGNKVYFGVYPGAEVWVFDMALPIQSNPLLPDQNPRVSFKIGDHQDRPYVNTFAEGLGFFGTVPGYGEIGGALVVFDTDKPADFEVFRNVVEDHSIIGLAYKDGYIYGSTSIHGGLGGGGASNTMQATDSAKMFIWDVAQKKKLLEWVPAVPGDNSKYTFISGLTFDEDGQLWAGVNGTLFAMEVPDKAALDAASANNTAVTPPIITKSKTIFTNVTAYGMWRPIHIRFASDGLIYTDLHGTLIVVDPDTLDHALIQNSVVLFTMDEDENLYYVNGGQLRKIEVNNQIYMPTGDVKLIGPSRVEPSSEFSLLVTGNQAYQLYNGDVRLTYNANHAELLSITGAEGTFLNYIKDESQGKIRVIFSQTGVNSFNGDDLILTLNFRSSSNSAATSLTLTTGSKFGAPHTGVSGRTYSQGVNSTQTIIIAKHGDVNGDGSVNIIDLVAVSKRVGQSGTNSMFDVNGDGSIDIADVMVILNEMQK